MNLHIIKPAACSVPKGKTFLFIYYYAILYLVKTAKKTLINTIYCVFFTTGGFLCHFLSQLYTLCTPTRHILQKFDAFFIHITEWLIRKATNLISFEKQKPPRLLEAVSFVFR